MTSPIQQFLEMVRIEHARIELLKQAADERGEFIINVTAAVLGGEITQAEADDLIARACGDDNGEA